jgi:hypothetical protein
MLGAAFPTWFGFSIWYSVSIGIFVYYYVEKLIDRKGRFFHGSSIACGAAQILGLFDESTCDCDSGVETVSFPQPICSLCFELASLTWIVVSFWELYLLQEDVNFQWRTPFFLGLSVCFLTFSLAFLLA